MPGCAGERAAVLRRTAQPGTAEIEPGTTYVQVVSRPGDDGLRDRPGGGPRCQMRLSVPAPRRLALVGSRKRRV